MAERAGDLAVLAAGCFRFPVRDTNGFLNRPLKERGEGMDSVMIIRVVAAVLFVAVLVLLIQRRRTRVK
jgi:hypothetical protein